jgi:hypothetical protein
MIRRNHEWYVASVPAPEGVWGWTPCMTWCEKHFGIDQEWGVGCWHYNSEGVFEFKNEADCIMFMLRWA